MPAVKSSLVHPRYKTEYRALRHDIVCPTKLTCSAGASPAKEGAQLFVSGCWTKRAEFSPPGSWGQLVATRRMAPTDAQPTLFADAGVENVNARVDELIDSGALRRVLAQTEIAFSNSMIESWWRTLKHQWLYLNTLDTVASLRRLTSFYVTEHNSPSCPTIRMTFKSRSAATLASLHGFGSRTKVDGRVAVEPRFRRRPTALADQRRDWWGGDAEGGKARYLRDRPMVVAQQPTESLVAADRRVNVDYTLFRFDQLIAEPLVTAFSMIMREIGRDSSPQRSFAEEDHPVETFGFDRKYESLRVRVQIRRSYRQPDDVRSGVVQESPKLLGVLPVAIENQGDAS